jgi:hypothetical protein
VGHELGSSETLTTVVFDLFCCWDQRSLPSWRWRQHVPPKHYQHLKTVHLNKNSKENVTVGL